MHILDGPFTDEGAGRTGTSPWRLRGPTITALAFSLPPQPPCFGRLALVGGWYGRRHDRHWSRGRETRLVATEGGMDDVWSGGG